jgi:phospholipase D3/4
MRRDSDLDIIVRLIDTAKEFVYIAVMDYFPSSLYASGGKNKYWDRIDTALRRAAFDRGVKVRVLGSVWKSTRRMMHK